MYGMYVCMDDVCMICMDDVCMVCMYGCMYGMYG